MDKREEDRFVAAAVRKNCELSLQVNLGNRHRIKLVGRERKGSLWITPRYSGYRVETTGQAQQLNSRIESLCGSPVNSHKEQEYKYWYIDDPVKVERIIDLFAKL